MLMDIFCKSTDDSLGRGTVCMEGKSVYRVNVNSSKNKTLPPSKVEVIQCNKSATRELAHQSKE